MRRALRAFTCLAAPAALFAVQPEWRFYKPSNTGVPGDYTHVVFIDREQRPWIPAYIPIWEEGGIARFDEASNTWLTISNVDYPAITSPRFNDIVQDASGMMWIATQDGLLRMDPDIGGPSIVRFGPENTPLPADEIGDLAHAPDGSIWMAIDDVSGGDPPGGLVRFQPATNQWTVYTTANGLPWGPQWPNWNSVANVAVVEDAGGDGYTVWFNSPYFGMATWREGVFQYFGDPHDIPPGAPTTPIGLTGNSSAGPEGELWVWTNNGLACRNPDGSLMLSGAPPGMDTEISVVTPLSGGRAMMGTYYSDVFLFEPGRGWQWLGAWATSHTYSFAEAANGDVWVGGIGGSARLRDGFWQRFRLTNTGMLSYWVEAIEFAPDGRVFVNANAAAGIGGFDIFDGERWTCVNNYNYGLGPAWGLPSDNTQAFCYRENGELALSPSGAQGMLDWDGQTYTYMVPQYEEVTDIEEDTLGRLWAAQPWYTKGLHRFDGEQHVFYTSQNSPLPEMEISKLAVDRADAGFIWLSTMVSVIHTDGQTWQTYPRELLGLTQWSLGHFINTFDVAEDGKLWIGTGQGLYHFDPATSQYTRYHRGNTPALPSSEVFHVLVAPDQSVWINTFDSVYPYPGGLTRFDGQEWTLWQQGSSPLPHNQTWALEAREVSGGYEVWVGTASEGIAVMTVNTGPAALPGDMNCDGLVSVSDISGFVLALTDPSGYAAQFPQCDVQNGDINADGQVSVSDIGPFVTLLTGQ